MLKIDVSALARVAQRVDQFSDQLPFALSRTMNESLKVAMKTLVEDTWPSHVNVKNRSFLKFAFGRAKFSTKKNLRVEINDERAEGRGKLNLHDKGGVKRNAKGGKIAVPSKALQQRRGTYGVPKAFRPKNLPHSFRKGDVIYQRTGRKNRKLKLMYVVKNSVPIHADVPFTHDFQRVMRTEMRQRFPIEMKAALRTAKLR